MSNLVYSVRASKPISYDLIKSKNLFSHRNITLLYGREKPGGNCVVICDNFIYDSLKEEIESYFKHHKINLTLARLDSSEVNKNIINYGYVADVIDSANINRRNEPVIAIGGGVVLDIVGFACSTYRRSIPCIKVPTTLMGYVDAAIGIKNGIDYNGSKNRIGSFEPPLLVILDKGFLETLPRRHLINGMAEIFKIAVIKDVSLYNDIKEDGKESILDNFQNIGDSILTKSIVGLITELEGNLYELDLCRPSDFGHTFSPIIEMNNINELLHGEAVSIDIALSCVIAAHRGYMGIAKLKEILSLMKTLDLPTYHPSLNTQMLMDGLYERTLHRNGKQNAPVPVINMIHACVFLNDITEDDISHAIDYLR